MIDGNGAAPPHRMGDLTYQWIPRLSAEPKGTPTCVAIGMFDGVHRGHRALLQAARAHADRHGSQLVAVTFDVHPRNVLGTGEKVPLLQAPMERYWRLLSAGADAVMVLPFTPSFARKPAGEFLDLLCAETDLQAVFVGEGFRFGAGRAGDCALLEAEGQRRGFEAHAVPPVEFGDRDISSTRIRKAIASGAIEEATSLLGVAHEVTVNVLAFDSRRQVAMFTFPPQISRPPIGSYLGRIRRMPCVPVTVEVTNAPQLSRIWHWPGEGTDSLSGLYAAPVTLEFLDTA